MHNQKIIIGASIIAFGLLLSGYLNVVFLESSTGACNPSYLGPPPNPAYTRNLCPLPFGLDGFSFMIMAETIIAGSLIIGAYVLIRGIRIGKTVNKTA